MGDLCSLQRDEPSAVRPWFHLRAAEAACIPGARLASWMVRASTSR